MTYSDYVIQVKQQQEKYPLYPKLEPAITALSKPRPYSPHIEAELLNEAYFYTGIKQVANSEFYYEFAQCETNEIFLERSRFLYAPVNPTVKQALLSKLPSLEINDPEAETTTQTYPEKPYTIHQSIESWPNWIEGSADPYYHPFLPGFIFAARVAAQPNGSILYEYRDVWGLFSPRDSFHVSNLRPITLDFPLGHTQPGELMFDECLRHKFARFPKKYHQNQIGRFSGYRTTEKYHSIPFYLYTRQDGNGFYSEYPPHD